MDKKDEIIKKLGTLSDSNLIELSNYIDFLKYKTKNPELIKATNLLDYFRQSEIDTWKDLANATRESGIKRGPVGGYMDKTAVKNWVSLNFNIDYELAEEAIELLSKQQLLNVSFHGNFN